MAKKEISISNNWRKRAKVMILRNDKNSDNPCGKKWNQYRRNRKRGKKEVQNKSELNYETVATFGGAGKTCSLA